jgi:hypothetical protein
VKEIDTLIADVYTQLKRKDGWFDERLSQGLSDDLASTLRGQFAPRPGPGTLRMSRMGKRCPKALWLSVHKPELAAPVQPWTEASFSVGHFLETYAITLAKAAGHTVTGEQDELVVDGITGHRDCVIDGHIVDVKSTSSLGFKKFKEGTIAQDDSFGYLDQLDGYLLGSAGDDLVTNKTVGYLWAIDKQLGKMVLYEHVLREASIRKRIRDFKSIVALDRAPGCTCETVPFGGSGNIALGVNAKYSEFRFECFPHLRTAIYSDGPIYFSHVAKWPVNKNGPLVEVDRYGVLVN